MSSVPAPFPKPSLSTLEAEIRKLRVNDIKDTLYPVAHLNRTKVTTSGVRKATLVSVLAHEIMKTFQTQTRDIYEMALVKMMRFNPILAASTDYIWRDDCTYKVPLNRPDLTISQQAPSANAAPHGDNCRCGRAHTAQRAPATTTGPSSSSFVDLQFTHSGFISPLERVSDPFIFNDTRGRVSTTTVTFRLTVDQADMADHSRRDGNEEYRVYWYMCPYADACYYLRNNPKRPVLLGYPHSFTMYLNAQQLSPDVINGRKPGYPIDITSLSKMSSDETNQLAINYRNNGMHVGMVMLAKVHTPASIIKEIRKKNLVSAEEVRRRFFKGPEPGNEDDDDDLVSTGSLVSLKCPLGLMRIATPTRSKYCQHPQCFDCETFLQMKNQVPSTKCPVCSQDIKSWEELVIDLYFEDILQKTSSNEDQVYIEADGSWKPKKPMEAEDVDSIVANKRLRINGNSDAIDLSDYSSSEDPRPNRNKRQRTEVIDLTIDSDDGEDEYEYEYYDSESSRMDDMYFDMSFPSMTQEDIALIDAVEASTQGQNDRNLSVAERAGVRGQAVMTTRSSQQAVPTTSDSGSSHVNVGTGAQTNVVSVDSRNVAITNAPAPSTSATPQTPTTQSRSVVSPPAANLASAAVETSGVNTNESARTASLAPTPRTKVSHKNTSRTTPSRPRLLDTTSDRTQSSSQSAGTLTSPTGARGSHQTPARLASTHYPNVLRHFMTLPLSHSGVTVANFNLPTSPQSARVRQSTSNEARSRSGSLPTSPTRVVGMSPAYISLITNQRISGSSAPQTSSSNGPHAPNEARPSA